MCDPYTISLIALGASTVVSTISSIQQGKAANKQAQFQAAVSRNNAILAEQQADDSLRRGRLAERQKRLQLSKAEGSQVAAFAANNVAINEGSPLDVLEFTAEQGELEALSIRNAAEREATGFRARGADLSAQATLFEAAGAQAQKAGTFKAFGTLLGGASQIAGTVHKFDKAGAFG